MAETIIDGSQKSGVRLFVGVFFAGIGLREDVLVLNFFKEIL